VARGRDLMRFYCPNDVTGAIVLPVPVARRKTVDSIYRVCLDRFRERPPARHRRHVESYSPPP